MTRLNAESRQVIRSALDAFKRRDRVTARRLAQHAAALAPDNEVPWLFMAILGCPRASFEYVKEALVHDPESKEAQQALVWAKARLDAQTAQSAPRPPDAAVQPTANTTEAAYIWTSERTAAGVTQPVQVEFSVLDTIADKDGSSLIMRVEVHNTGDTAFSLTENDIILMDSSGATLALLESYPVLPREIQSNDGETFAFTFANPPSSTALLSILGIEFEMVVPQ